MVQKKEKKALRLTFANIGYSFEDKEFEILYNRALQIEGVANSNQVSIRSFVQAMNNTN